MCDRRVRASQMLQVFESLLNYLRNNKVSKLIYKQIPHIYHRFPSEEDSYALFRFGATIYRRDISTTVFLKANSRFQERRLRSVKKAVKTGVDIRLSNDFPLFWPVLEKNLLTSYRLKPVHSLSEILSLKLLFPNFIKLYCAYLDEQVVAGTVIYDSDCVAHAQYIASTELGRNIGALDFLFYELLTSEFKSKKYFDFGISTEHEGQYLNL